MKRVLFLMIFLLTGLIGCKTSKHVTDKKQEVVQAEAPVADVTAQVTNFSDQSTWLLGYFSPGQLAQPPHSVWYIQGYDNYMFDTDAVNKLTEIDKSDLSLKIIMGTWCPDSRREVPKFIRILDVWKFPLNKVQFIGVDNSKRSPVADYSSLNIQRVPTFIFYKNKIEAGRIIENPITSLEQDMVNILTRKE